MQLIRPALICFGLMTLLCGALYPFALTAAAQFLFPYQANGSIIEVSAGDGSSKAYGSELIGQAFSQPEYLIGRPLGVTNLSPVSVEQKALMRERLYWWQALDPSNSEPIPMDLLTASGSGVDPHISPAAARYQVSRIAKLRNLDQNELQALIDQYTSGAFLGLFGEPAVNVLQVNLALDARK